MTNSLKKLLVLLCCFIPLTFGAACEAQQPPSKDASEQITQMMRAAMSKTTQHVITTQKGFCDAVSKESLFNKNLDVHAQEGLALNDLTIQSICLDGYKRGDDGMRLAVNTALIAQTVDEVFEHQSLLFSMIATSPKTADAEKAWAFHILAKNGMALVDGNTVSDNYSISMGGYYKHKLFYLTEQHRKLEE